jgi:hypothetical protein
MARLTFLNGPLAGRTFDLRPGVTRIGRAPNNEIQVLEVSISGSHCELFTSDTSVVVRDLGSTNGVYIDGKRISKDAITSKRNLRLGNLDVTIDVGGPVVAIPEREKPPEIFANFLIDGAPACQNHATVAATQKCDRCEKTWCNDCVRMTGLVGSARRLVTCIECGGGCTPIVYAPPKKKSFLNRLGDTFMLKRPK